MMTFRILLIALIFIPATNAQQPDGPEQGLAGVSAWGWLTTFEREQRESRRKDRVEWAARIREQYQKLNNLIPNLSPREQDFLKNEQAEIRNIDDWKTGDRRHWTLANTAEYQISNLKKLIKSNIRCMDLIADESVTHHQETHCWLIFIRNTINPHEWSLGLKVLVEKGVVSEEVLTEIGFSHSDDWGGEYGGLISAQAKRALNSYVITLHVDGYPEDENPLILP